MFTVFLNAAFFSCNPESLSGEVAPQACCDEDGNIPPPPPDQLTGNGG